MIHARAAVKPPAWAGARLPWHAFPTARHAPLCGLAIGTRAAMVQRLAPRRERYGGDITKRLHKGGPTSRALLRMCPAGGAAHPSDSLHTGHRNLDWTKRPRQHRKNARPTIQAPFPCHADWVTLGLTLRSSGRPRATQPSYFHPPSARDRRST